MALENQTYIDSDHTRTMKIGLSTKDPRLRAFPRHAGQGVFLNFSHRSAAGAPLRRRRHSSHQMKRVVIIPAWYMNTTIFIGNAQKLVNAQQGFHPRRFGSPQNAIAPEQVLHHHRSKRRGGMREQGLSPPSSYPCFVFHLIVKGILQIREKHYNPEMPFNRSRRSFLSIPVTSTRFCEDVAPD